MTEFNESTSLEKKDLNQSELGTTTERLTSGESELGKSLDELSELSEDELNEPIDELAMPVMDSADCRSECKYNTGDKTKYTNYGYSD